MSTSELHGVIVPVVTPVDDEDRVDEPAFRAILRRLIGAGVHGLFVGGSAGEGPLLVMREWVRMMEIAADEVREQLPLLGGAIDTSTRRVIERIKILHQSGYRWFVTTPTFYTTLKCPAEHLRLYLACAENARGMEMIAYNIPSCTASELPPEVVFELARRGAIRYCKESSDSQEYFGHLLAGGKELGLRMLQGSEPNVAWGLKLGAWGIVPVCANYEPETFVRAWEAARRGDDAALDQLQDRILYIRQRLLRTGVNWIAGIKYAVSTQGIGSGKPVSPLEPLSEEVKRVIDGIVPA